MAETIGLSHKHTAGTPYEHATALRTVKKRLEKPMGPVKEGRLLTESRLLERSLWRFTFEDNMPTQESALKTYNDLIVQIPKSPENYRQKYVDRLRALTREKTSERERMRHLSGVIFELQRITKMAKRKSVEVDYGYKPFKVTYSGYNEHLRWDHIVNHDGSELRKPSLKITSEIENDVPVRLKSDPGKPYIYEVKDASGHIYGSQSPASRINQLLKYNAAVSQGLASGCTFEIKGRFSPNMLKLILSEHDPLSNIEVLFTLPLPSGREYSFILKPSKKPGLDLASNDSDYTGDADRRVINGIKTAMSIKDKSLVSKIISQFTEDDFREDIPMLRSPHLIEDSGQLTDYLFSVNSKVWERFMYLTDRGIPQAY